VILEEGGEEIRGGENMGNTPVEESEGLPCENVVLV
jgi:hypothetical protein